MFGNHDDSYENDALNQFENDHEGSKTHDTLAGAAVALAMREWQKKEEREGKPQSYETAKDIMAGLAAAAATQLIETKGMDGYDSLRAKHEAAEQAKMALSKSGMYGDQDYQTQSYQGQGQDRRDDDYQGQGQDRRDDDYQGQGRNDQRRASYNDDRESGFGHHGGQHDEDSYNNRDAGYGNDNDRSSGNYNNERSAYDNERTGYGMGGSGGGQGNEYGRRNEGVNQSYYNQGREEGGAGYENGGEDRREEHGDRRGERGEGYRGDNEGYRGENRREGYGGDGSNY